MKKLMLVLMLFVMTVGLKALDPQLIALAWDYNLSANSGVTGFQIFVLPTNNTPRTLIATVPLPSPLPPEDGTGFAVFTASVTPDKTGKREFIVVVITDDPTVFSADSNIVAKVVRPDSGKRLR